MMNEITSTTIRKMAANVIKMALKLVSATMGVRVGISRIGLESDGGMLEKH
jgi:hypothetical protein